MNGTIFTNSMRNELPSTVRNSFALHQLKIYVKDELLSLFEITAPNYSNKRVKCLKKLCTSSNIHLEMKDIFENPNYDVLLHRLKRKMRQAKYI